MPLAGTFDYVAVVPEAMAGCWPLRCRTAVEETGQPMWDSRLVGLSPTLEITDAGLTPNPGFSRGAWRPEVLRSRLGLRATTRDSATVAGASFYVDRGLTRALRRGDQLHIARTGAAGVGLSVIREGRLVLAVGAVTAVPLGENMTAKVAEEVMAEAEAVVRRRDPTFAFPELPVEVNIAGQTVILLRGTQTIGDYGLTIWHGRRIGEPGVDAAGVIARLGLCPDTALNASAMLLAADGVELESW